MHKSAIISEDGQYRYQLTRIWDEMKPMTNFIGLNPSTADATLDDPTIRRCINFATFWGYGGFYMTNLFAYRTFSPAILREATDPIGRENDMHLLDISSKVDRVVFAWGVGGTLLARDQAVLKLIRNGHYIALSKGGHPRHPLYLKSDLTLKPF